MPVSKMEAVVVGHILVDGSRFRQDIAIAFSIL